MLFAYSYQAAIMLAGLWLTPFLLRHLGQHDYGLWLVGLQVLTYLTLADFGVIALLPRNVAYATGRAGSVKEATDLPDTIGQTAVIVLCQTLIVAIAAGLFWTLLPRASGALRGPIGLVLAGFTVLFPLRIFAAVLEGLQEQAFVIRANLVAWGLSLLANVAWILAGWGLYALAIGWLIAQAFSAAACGWRLWKRYPEVLPSRLHFANLRQALGQLGRGFWMSANQLGQVLLGGSEVLIIGKFMGPALTVPYACTAKLANVLTNQPQLLMHLAVPGLSELKAGSSRQRVHQVVASLTQGMMLLSGLLFCVVLVANQAFVHWWVGPERYAGFLLTSLILIQVLLRHFNLTFAYAVFCFGYERRMAITALLDGIVTAGTMLALTPKFGYSGAAAGSILGVCLVSLPMNVSALMRELQLPLVRLLAPLGPWSWRFTLIAAGCIVLSRTWTPQTFFQIVLTAALVAVVYLAVLAGPVLRGALGHYVQFQVARFFGRWPKPSPDLVAK
jgi:O-antigen/teichoic acid export membrane protein